MFPDLVRCYQQYWRFVLNVVYFFYLLANNYSFMSWPIKYISPFYFRFLFYLSNMFACHDLLLVMLSYLNFVYIKNPLNTLFGMLFYIIHSFALCSGTTPQVKAKSLRSGDYSMPWLLSINSSRTDTDSLVSSKVDNSSWTSWQTCGVFLSEYKIFLVGFAP